MRCPRSSFHQLVVTASGIRLSSSLAAAITACRTSRNSCVGSIGQNTCRPRLPLVLIHASRPASRSTARSACAAVTASAMPVPGCGSRSIRSSTGWSASVARDAHGWNTIVFICAAHTADAISPRKSCGCRRPLLYVTVTASTKAGAPFGGFLEKNASPPTPSGKRSSETGRCPFAAMKGSATAMRYSASSRLVMPTSGHSTRSGFEMPTSRSPSGPGTVSVMRGDAIPRR